MSVREAFSLTIPQALYFLEESSSSSARKVSESEAKAVHDQRSAEQTARTIEALNERIRYYSGG